tara:strand:+ start:49 stop:3741 length:3693 start_codon:yes stop_codon:yes gene_type:complete
MSLENALINEPNITVGTQDNSLTNVFTDVINIDGFTIFRQRNNFFKRDEKTKQISKLAKGSSQVHRWYKIKDKQDIVYLNGDLILDNLVFTNGNISCNIDTSRYNSNLDNSAINFLGIGYGSISDEFNDRDTESQKIIVNDAWKEIDDSSFFCSKNLIINGSLYVKNGIHSNKESNIYITELSQRNYNSENIIKGTTQWSNVEITTYTDKTVYIDGDIIVASNIITDSSNYNDLSQYDVLEPYKSIEIDNITLKDSIKISNSDIILKNENVEINAKEDISFLGKKIYIDGDINFQYKYANVLKEIYEHSVIYNSIGSMQKRTAFTGQIPIRYGSKHELGYDLKWSGTASNFDIFKLEGEIFLTDTITKDGFRILSDFVLTINPFNNSQEYPGLDKLHHVNHDYSKDMLKDLLDVNVIRMSSKHVKLRIIWETIDSYKELYYANLDLNAIIPNHLAKRLMITPYYNVHRNGEIDEINMGSIKPFLKYEDERHLPDPNIYYYQNVDIANLKIIGEGIPNERTSLTVYKTNLNETINVAEFWDKYDYSSLNLHALSCLNCQDDHFVKGNSQGVVIGKSGITAIGINQNNEILNDVHSSNEIAQLNIMTNNTSINRMKVDGNYNRKTIIDKNANLIIGNEKNFKDRTDIINPLINEYGLDVNGHAYINGSFMMKSNDIIKTFYSVNNYINLDTTENQIDCYVSWGINEENSFNIFQPINLDVDYYITSTNKYPIQCKQQKYSILINPRNNIDQNMPNLISVFPREGQSMSVFRNVDVYSTRLEYNTIKLTFKAQFATFEHETAFSSIAYANITIIGESSLNQFFISNELDYYGIIDLPPVDDLYLNLRIGIYKLDIYNYLKITDYSRVTFKVIDLTNNNLNVYIQDMFLYIISDKLGRSFDLKIQAINRKNQIVSIPLHIYCFEFVNIYPTNNIYYLNELLIDLIEINLYDFYNLSNLLDSNGNQLYPWENVKDLIRFKSKHDINRETGTLNLRGYQKGESYILDIQVYLLNNEETDYLLVNDEFKIYYNEIIQIETLYNSNIIVYFNLTDYENISNLKFNSEYQYHQSTTQLSNIVYNYDFEIFTFNLENQYSNINIQNLFNNIDINLTLNKFSNFIINYNNEYVSNNVSNINIELTSNLIIERENYYIDLEYNLNQYSNFKINNIKSLYLLDYYSNVNLDFIRFNTENNLVNENFINLTIDEINKSVIVNAYYLDNYYSTVNSNLTLEVVNF